MRFPLRFQFSLRGHLPVDLDRIPRTVRNLLVVLARRPPRMLKRFLSNRFSVVFNSSFGPERRAATGPMRFDSDETGYYLDQHTVRVLLVYLDKVQRGLDIDEDLQDAMRQLRAGMSGVFRSRSGPVGTYVMKAFSAALDTIERVANTTVSHSVH